LAGSASSDCRHKTNALNCNLPAAAAAADAALAAPLAADAAAAAALEPPPEDAEDDAAACSSFVLLVTSHDEPTSNGSRVWGQLAAKVAQNSTASNSHVHGQTVSRRR